MTGMWKITKKQIMTNVLVFLIRKEKLFLIPLQRLLEPLQTFWGINFVYSEFEKLFQIVQCCISTDYNKIIDCVIK